MIKVFNGNWRGLGERSRDVGILLDFEFRTIIHEFKGAQLHVFLAICLHADEDGLCYPSYDTLERETGYARSTISQALKELCEKEIDGERVLAKWRDRDDEGKFTGGNNYIIFPSEEELKHADSQSSINPTMDLPNSGKPNQKLNHTLNGNHVKDESPAGDTPPQEQLTRNERLSILEEHFSSVTGIPCPKRNTKKQKRAAGALWWGPLDELSEWCSHDVWETKRLISAAVQEMEDEGLTIKSPKSIVGNATDIYRKQNGGGTRTEDEGWFLVYERRNGTERHYPMGDTARDMPDDVEVGTTPARRVKHYDDGTIRVWWYCRKVGGEWREHEPERVLA